MAFAKGADAARFLRVWSCPVLDLPRLRQAVLAYRVVSAAARIFAIVYTLLLNIRTQQRPPWLLGGADQPVKHFSFMYESLPILVENALEIAWDFLERSGEIADAAEASEFLLRIIGELVRTGERRRLMLSNRAIDEYKKYKAERLAAGRIAPPRNHSIRTIVH
jgi:hypothetical protein